MHRSPLSENTPKIVASIAASRSASAKTTAGDLPPSSIERPFRCGAAFAKMSCPVRLSPVNEISGTSGCLTSASPASSPSPWTRLNTPAGRPGLLEDPGPQGRRQRRELRRLEDDRVAGGQRGSELPRLEHERRVPRRDEPGDADRLAVDVVELAAGHLEGVVRLGDDQVGEEPEVLGRAAGLAERLGDRQAGVEALELGEPGVARLDDVGDAVQDPRALARQHPRPRALLERPPRRRDGPVDVRRLARCGVQVRLVRHRVEDLERRTVRGVDVLAADVVLEAVGEVGGHGSPLRVRSSGARRGARGSGMRRGWPSGARGRHARCPPAARRSR